MRKISQATLDFLSSGQSVEPINIVSILWKDGSQPHQYSDKKIGNFIEGKLLELADLESIINIDKNNSSTSIKITLDDTDGTIKTIFNNTDIHGRPVVVYQWFYGLPITEAFVIFEGLIASPIEWNEGSRTLSFDVLSKLYDREVGFSVEEGQFTNVPRAIVGKAWPLIFGTVTNAATLQMDLIPNGTTRIPLGIRDENLNEGIGWTESKLGETLGKAACYSEAGAALMLEAQGGGGKALFEQGQALQRKAEDMFRQADIQIANDLSRLRNISATQTSYDSSVIPIVNGVNFRQDEIIQLDINGAEYRGSFHGDDFYVISRKSPFETVHKAPGGGSSIGSNIDYVGGRQEDWDKYYASLLFGFDTGGASSTSSSSSEYNSDPCAPPNLLIINNSPTTEKPDSKQFWFANAGTGVKPGQNYKIRHIITIVPNSTLIAISARVSVNGFKVLAPIPPQYYNITTVNYGPIVAMIVELKQPLSTIPTYINAFTPLAYNWEDEVYATVKSAIGPNIVDIMIYLIQTFTILQIDFTSFNIARTQLANYPANFALTEKKNIVDLLKEIAFQAKLSIWISNYTFYLKYLPDEGTPVDTLTIDDIEQQSLVVTTTETENLVTKFVAKWKPDAYLPQIDIVLRYNIIKYGIIEQTFNFYIYNDPTLITKVSTFWLIRMANTWKRIKCKTFINKLNLETFDTITLNLTNYVSNDPVNAIVEKAAFNSNDLSVELEAWIPIRLGEMDKYPFAFPAGLDVSIEWPPISEVAGSFPGGNNIGAGASGDLNSKSSQNGGSTGGGGGPGDTGINPGDRGSSLPNVVTAVIPYSNSQGAINPPGVDYRINSYPEKGNTNPVQLMPRSVPFKISGPGNGPLKYKGFIYPYGLDNDGTEIEATQLQQDPTDTIPADTWWMVTQLSWFENNVPQTRYYMQYPIWAPAVKS